jgi:hypothetical protein
MTRAQTFAHAANLFYKLAVGSKPVAFLRSFDRFILKSSPLQESRTKHLACDKSERKKVLHLNQIRCFTIPIELHSFCSPSTIFTLPKRDERTVNERKLTEVGCLAKHSNTRLKDHFFGVMLSILPAEHQRVFLVRIPINKERTHTDTIRLSLSNCSVIYAFSTGKQCSFSVVRSIF